MNTIQTIDRLNLQRLVDGELDHQERAALLAQFDREPSLWRHVALAFVEDKAITTEVRKEKSLVSTAEYAKPSLPMTAAISNLETKSNWKTLLSLAASLLLVLAGFAIGNRIGNIAPKKELIAQTPVPPPETDNDRPASDGLEQAGTLRFIGRNDEIPNNEIPIYQPPQFEEHLLGRKEQELRKLQGQLRRHGLGLNMQVKMLEGQLPDGRRVVVPIRNFEIERRDF